MNTIDLRKILETIRENQYDGGPYDLDTITASMMKEVGNVDSALRDDLIYVTFARLITEDRLTTDRLKKLLAESLDERHLFYRLGEFETDSVFTRSFSVLIVALILIADRSHAFLDRAEVLQIKERLIDYFSKELDRRGYVEGKGWAHSIAHTADAMDELARHELMEANDLIELLETIQRKLFWEEGVYIHNEDERLALAAFAILSRRKLKDDRILQWIENFQHRLEREKATSSNLQHMYMRLNVRNFLRSLFFRLRFEACCPIFQDKIQLTLNAIRVF